MYIPLTFSGALQKCLYASGGYEGYFISGSTQYKYHWFTGSANLEVQKGTIDNVEIYVVGGGGGGGNRSTTNGGGGGGGGGVNYTYNGRLFKGVYNVVVGAGGGNQPAGNTNGFAGALSSFIGSNLSMIAFGGDGGGGTTSAGGTGGVPNGGAGGNGGTSAAGNGATGLIIDIDGYQSGFGCGGGGAENNSSGAPSGFSCNGNEYGRGAAASGDSIEGARFYGMGGGGGNVSRTGKQGGSGSVIIKYPIYDYCSNYFNETGSCGCREITIDISDPLNYYPYQTGSYIYMPCGGDRFVSGSLIAYAPLVACVVSNSYYSITSESGFGGGVGFTTSGPECVSASLTPVACSPEAFVPTCTSSIVTIYSPSGSGGNPNDFYYVQKNESTHSLYTSTSDRVKYFCISTGSLFNGNQRYPQLLNGNFAALYNTASCNVEDFVASWAGKPSGTGTTTYTYYECNGNRNTIAFSRPSSNYTGSITASLCRDFTAPITSVNTGTQPPNVSVTTAGSCIESYFSASACGCP